MEEFNRLAMLVGTDAVDSLSNKRIAVFGIGGVGGYVCEGLVRSGIGHFLLVDGDVVSVTNINRQIVALQSTIGKPKVDVMKARMLDINPNVSVEALQMFYDDTTDLDLSSYDYVIDCIDSVKSKLRLIEECKKVNTPIICSMGTGNRLNPKGFEICDISKTHNCSLAKVMRKECKVRNLGKVDVLYNPNDALTPLFETDEGKRTVGSSAFSPSSAGLMIGSFVVSKLLQI